MMSKIHRWMNSLLAGFCLYKNELNSKSFRKTNSNASAHVRIASSGTNMIMSEKGSCNRIHNLVNICCFFFSAVKRKILCNVRLPSIRTNRIFILLSVLHYVEPLLSAFNCVLYADWSSLLSYAWHLSVYMHSMHFFSVGRT